MRAAARIGAAVPVESIERLLRAAGQDRAAQDLRRLGLRSAEPSTQGLRAELVADHGDTLDLAPGFRTAWRGGPLAVYDLPTRFGPCLLRRPLARPPPRPPLGTDPPSRSAPSHHEGPGPRPRLVE